MTETITIKMGEMRTAHNPAVLETAGVGSCLVVILYDEEAKVGGLAHAMLPHVITGQEASSRFVDIAIDRMVPELMALGADKSRIVAKLIGGAHMFALYGNAQNGIGAKNIDAAKERLKLHHIPVSGEETGGTVGRNVRFDLHTGVCNVETKM